MVLEVASASGRKVRASPTGWQRRGAIGSDVHYLSRKGRVLGRRVELLEFGALELLFDFVMARHGVCSPSVAMARRGIDRSIATARVGPRGTSWPPHALPWCFTAIPWECHGYPHVNAIGFHSTLFHGMPRETAMAYTMVLPCDTVALPWDRRAITWCHGTVHGKLHGKAMAMLWPWQALLPWHIHDVCMVSPGMGYHGTAMTALGIAVADHTPLP